MQTLIVRRLKTHCLHEDTGPTLPSSQMVTPGIVDVFFESLSSERLTRWAHHDRVDPHRVQLFSRQATDVAVDVPKIVMKLLKRQRIMKSFCPYKQAIKKLKAKKTQASNLKTQYFANL